ncbi:hypothetical protein NF700_06535 [Sphingomonadaceae bacterium OTU29MARTA1]|uniref:hypothetical protein n=1 Tax=Sphingomonas sp. Leaf37 TaxID=2876552 RepID=UPI001E367EA6|nr:hypothetical protein [Sphingomonas sp. Leaf37]USU09915.1 hypothetical protein NF700_06535 [Sphingomonadaceae bacterium OTU29MARTA1]USU13377.1 hypothetical protein NF701_05990 [Sphingomonadaceae bacterium OTU29THOMA1]
MFMDFRDQPPPPRWEPRPGRRRLTPRERKAVEAILLFNAVMLVCGPLAGATLLQAIPALFR